MHAHADCYWNFVGPELHSQFSLANSTHSGMHNLLTKTKSPCCVVLSRLNQGPGKIRVWWQAQALLDQFWIIHDPCVNQAWMSVNRPWTAISKRERPFLNVKGHFPKNQLFWDCFKIFKMLAPIQDWIEDILKTIYFGIVSKFLKCWHQFKIELIDIHSVLDLLKGILYFPIGKSV